jgi:hypothetical protein
VCSGTFQDTDGDLTCDANDGCPTDPDKIAPGICGCGVSDVDSDSDGLADCNDNCPNLAGVQGDPCTDGNPCTINDAISAVCVCEGTPVTPPTVGVSGRLLHSGPQRCVDRSGRNTYTWAPAAGLSATSAIR